MTDRLTLDRFLPYRLVRASDLVSQRFAALYKARYGISRPEWRTFAILGEVDGVTATEIGRRSTMHKTKVSRAVAALEARGWLIRQIDEADRRVEHLRLTPSGRKVYGELATLAHAFQAELAEDLGPAAEGLEAGLDAVEARLMSGDGAAQGDR
ncbi:MarR family winged helix-turn-helix transcriptional regulator [Stappia sp.]|uniref:MarR family winged helix-turn-helix transcriptional regulator n=1 Tax=Stappia sp. TaxID=1870903 RepID=UPI0032D8FAC1